MLFRIGKVTPAVIVKPSIVLAVDSDRTSIVFKIKSSFCCNRADATFVDKKMQRHYCVECKDDINKTAYSTFGRDDLERIFKINEQDELKRLLGIKDKYEE